MRDLDKAAYLPADRRQALVGGFELPPRTRGAALFADIAGFTRLSRELTEAYGSRNGVDVLSEVLEAVYSVVVDEIHAQGGSVIGFSGDAVTCWFDDHPRGLATGKGAGDPPANGAGRAVACARSLTRSMDLLPPVSLPDAPRGDRPRPANPSTGNDQPGVKMAVKVAVASGEVSRSLAGNPAYQVVEILGGATVARLADLEHEADDGQVLVDEATLAILAAPTEVTVTTRRSTPSGDALVLGDVSPSSGCRWDALEEGRLPDEAVQPWIGWQIRDRADSALTELRPTVALFVRFTPFSLDTDTKAAGDLDRFVRWVQDLLAPVDGNLIQVTIGDKSSYLYISFGAPRSHEDLAARAATVALQLLEVPGELAMVRPLHLGIAEGMSRVGAYGSREALTYGALGDGTNLAARLMSAADPGTILVSDRVAEGCRGAFRFIEHAPVQAKGFDEPVLVTVLEGRTGYLAPEIAHRRTLVGRDVELEILVTRLRLLEMAPGGEIRVRGEAGSGKSHLIAEVKRRVAADSDVTWLATRADELTRSALQPFLALLRDLTFQELASTEDDRRSLFDATIDALVDDLQGSEDDTCRTLAFRLDSDRSFLAALIDLADEDSPYGRHDPRRRYERGLEAFDVLLRAESTRRPVVIHIGDGQWLDEHSHQLLDLLRITATEARVALVVDERVDPGTDTAVLGPLPAMVIDLRPLEVDGVTTLVTALLGGDANDDLVRLITERSQGSPLFVEHLVTDLTERRRLDRDAHGLWGLVDSTDDELPVSLSALLISRLDRLPPEVTEVARMASVIGLDVPLTVLASLLDHPADLDATIGIGTAAGIWRMDPDQHDQIAFHHALVRDAAYTMQPAARLRAAHAEVARVLAAVDDPRLNHDASIARHYERAGDPARALVHLRGAAAAALRLPAPAEARALLVRAHDAATTSSAPPSTRIEILRDLAAAATATGDYSTAIAELEQALDLAPEPGVATDLLQRLGDARARCGQLDEAESAFEAGVEALQLALDPGMAGRLYAGLAMVNAERDDLEAAMELAELSLLFARTDDDPAAQAWAHHRLGIIALRRRAHDEARTHANEALVAFIGLGRLDGQAGARNTLGLLAIDEGRVDEGLAELDLAVTLFEQAGNEHGLACALDNLADALRRQQRDDEAFAHLERAVSILARIGLTDQTVLTTMWRAGTW